MKPEPGPVTGTLNFLSITFEVVSCEVLFIVCCCEEGATDDVVFARCSARKPSSSSILGTTTLGCSSSRVSGVEKDDEEAEGGVSLNDDKGVNSKEDWKSGCGPR